jgi:hypothetical protein
VFLLLCLRCRGETAASDDARPPTRCRRCGGALDSRRADVIDDPSEVRRRVLRTLVPLSDGVIGFGILEAGLSALALAVTLMKAPTGFTTDDLFTLVGGTGFGIIGGLIAGGGWMIRRGQYWQLCLVASGLTLFSPLVVGVPLGAWGLWKLTRPEVKAVFVVR